eukprot:1082561-Prymnesium_polylepis.1
MDFGMAAGCQLLFVCLFLGGLLVRLYQDIANDTGGSAALAYRYLGFHSPDDVIIVMILVAFAMVVVLATTLGGDAYMHVVQKRLQSSMFAMISNLLWQPVHCQEHTLSETT